MFEPPEAVRLRALSRGAKGEAWLASLPGRVDALAEAWALRVGAALAGGTEGLVLEAQTADGGRAVLKLALPDADPDRSELRTLLAAHGRGYAKVLAHDAEQGALLLERLGPQLASLNLPVVAQMAIICATLAEAWMPPPDGPPFMDGAEKALSLAALIEDAWAAFDRPCARRTVETALAFAEARGRAFDPARAVLAHGDAHAWNTLQVPGEDRFKLVDPDGLFVEPAYDLAIPMREWSAELLAGDPVALALRRCRRLADLTGLDPAAIWQWGYVERLATGLHCLQVGLIHLARDFLVASDALAGVEPP